jgi:hypothetical protein
VTVVEQIDKLRILSRKKDQAQVTLNDKRAFQTRVRQLEAILEEWTPLFQLFVEFKENGICEHLTIRHAGFCHRTLTDLLKAVEGGNYGSISLDAPSLKLFNDLGQSFRDELRSELEKSWKNFVRDLERNALGERFLEQYDYGDSSATVRQLQTLLAQLKALGNQLPLEKGSRAIADVRNVFDALKCGVLQLPEDGMPDEVRTFLTQARSPNGAPLSNLSEKVLEWLKEHRADGKFQVRVDL